MKTIPGVAIPSVEQTSDETHEYIFWEDGQLTIEDPMFQYDRETSRDHAALSLAQVVKLKELLNSDRVTALLSDLS